MLAATLLLSSALAVKQYDRALSKQLVPMLQEVVRFETYENNPSAHAAQKEWLIRTAGRLGFVARDAGKITEIELPAAPGSPVLGLVVHGDVQPVDAAGWEFPPFEGRVKNGVIHGRGVADDKGPLVQALLAMKALEQSGIERTHTIRLLVGSEEESEAGEIGEYLKTHEAPDYSLVLDSAFPVVVGEKAWQAMTVSVGSIAERENAPFVVESLKAGLAPSIVPDRAEIVLRGDTSSIGTFPAPPPGTRIETVRDGDRLRIVAHGRSAHSGVNIEGGRNALVALARTMEGKLPRGGARDLLDLARVAGTDLRGTGLGIAQPDPLWGGNDVSVATILPDRKDPSKTTMMINIRRIPPVTGPELRERMKAFVAAWNTRTGSSFEFDENWYWDDEPLVFDPEAKLIRRLLAIYAKSTGTAAKPVVSGGGTYAKRLPNSIAFGMWFPGKPYPGHDVNEKMPVEDLHRGTRILIEALTDIAAGPRILQPFQR